VRGQWDGTLEANGVDIVRHGHLDVPGNFVCRAVEWRQPHDIPITTIRVQDEARASPGWPVFVSRWK